MSTEAGTYQRTPVADHLPSITIRNQQKAMGTLRFERRPLTSARHLRLLQTRSGVADLRAGIVALLAHLLPLHGQVLGRL